MKLSTRAQYGLRMLCQLALEYHNGPMQMSEIGEREGISEKYLGQIMLILRSSGLVASVRGAQGGYYLNRPPHAVRLLEVFEILEGNVLETEGRGDEPAESRTMRPAAGEVWDRMREAMRGVLESYTLEDLLGIQLQKRGYGEYSI